MCKAPIGYSNKITEDGKKYIKPIESDAKIIKWAFEKVAQGQYNVDQIFKEASKRGIRCCRANFWNLIHNPVYCGKIYLSGYKDEQPRHVPGLHDPIITEDLFYEVQDYLNGKKKIYRTQLGSTEIFQLRGFILCPQCGKILTASASKGRAIK